MSCLSIGISVNEVNESILKVIFKYIFKRNFEFVKGYVYDEENDKSVDYSSLPKEIPYSYNSFIYAVDKIELNISFVKFKDEIGIEINTNYENINLEIFDNNISVAILEKSFLNVCNELKVNYIFADPDENIEYTYNELIENLSSIKTYYPILIVNENEDYKVYKSGMNLEGI